MRAATYGRVSTQAQADEGFSLSQQREALIAYCEAQGWTHIEHVAYEGVSGTETDRPGIRRLEELAKARVIDVIVCAKIDRLSRLAWFGERFIADMQKLGTAVVFAEQRFDATPIGDFHRHIMGGVAQLDHAQIRERLMKGRAQKAIEKRTMPSGFAPFGLRQISVAEAAALPEFAGRDGETIIVEEEAAVVREAFRRYAAGEGMTVLCKWLQADPIAGSRGVWKHVRLKWMLRNTAYSGVRYYRGQAIPCPAIVDVETWEKTLDRLNRTTRDSGRPSLIYLLRGCVFCAECKNKNGTPRRCIGWRGSHNSTNPSYVATRHYRCPSMSDFTAESCGISMRAERLENEVRKVLTRNLQPGVLAATARKQAEAEWESGTSIEVEIANLQQGLAQIDKEESRVIDLHLAGFSPKLIQQRLKPVQARRAQALAALEAAEYRLANREEPDAAAARVEAIVAEAREDLTSNDPARVQRVYRSWVEVTLRFAKAPIIKVTIPG